MSHGVLISTFRETDLDGEVTFLDRGEIIVHKDATGKITATRNRCKHQSGRFLKTRDCVLTCPRHGWQLDVSTMRYVHPTGELHQAQLRVERTADGTLQLFEAVDSPWEFERQPKAPLSPAELTIRFYAHACVEIQCGSKRLFTDPWLIGPAFTRGWWLAHQPPSDWLDHLAAADAIYISHNHSDHLNLHTLRPLAARNPQVPVFVPAFERDACGPLLRSVGLNNITSLPFGIWMPLGDYGRLMILQDATGRDDSGLLVEYKGHRILNTVDCQNLCNGALPNADVLLTSFAGGASGYPLCWEGHTEQRIAELVHKKRHAILLRVLDMVQKVAPRIYIPFAGYFVEAHPADHDIKQQNVKNTAQAVCELVRSRRPATATWIPEAGGLLDLAMPSPLPSSQQAQATTVRHNFEPYLQVIRASQHFRPLQTLVGLKTYFCWAGFQGDLVLHVIETTEDFHTVLREFFVDFADLSFPRCRPSRMHRYLRMRCRSDVFRHVLQHGLPWEEISIGFQARFYREPDVYNFDFWDHFQSQLPHEPPQWQH